MRGIFWPSLLILLASWALPVQAFDVYIPTQNVVIKPGPDLRSGNLTRLSKTTVPLKQVFYAPDGELWCQIRLQGNQTGWVQARYLDPALSKNLPLRLQDIPAPLLFYFAQRQIGYANLNDAGFKTVLQKNMLLIEVAQIKQRWDFLRSRHDFLDISRRVGIKINAREFQDLKQEQKTLEKQFQNLMTQIL
ncbi:hypothetical protein COW36_15340 [bacterium (Candidatus Blackallbacteria) CG17_big_fil_post_rev_8_21_14_2_50_48_46]|uniref:SH3b domain-containing protein n=1 Tax=bacterium (Candidatus Blackallbacteria) CG17_big_fil_post_rev_8_21_14_2_50_48_46 TaxID=2014261 RepID=A0A2M7G2R4_9BACT|nr:MAG: hypothetical protein COW64_11210 [bacterium (Candidatus Blackallbacteria) CG18_big_fil_WC_8_21_14_2_50_49_26]PIW16083.1 MAG: hypothetical protein COW36_15340 [bacterium (Candidatus Blackallbacteria) CG17_big_fil_post_rev_8_21_14_2_50_48_46]PIW50495.1 MAG: hypothetical protein COW20_03055 [bacterium (Candidatus Blackallbacteria) CG13_big_fil_rev_8_21_14_2_50_49_14]